MGTKCNADRKVKILVIRYRRVGDAVLATSLLTSLKKTIPNCETDYVLDAGIAPLFENHPDIDNLITFTHEEKHSFLKYISKVRRLVRAKRYDIIIDLRSTVNTIPFALFSLRSGYRIAINKPYTRLFYNHFIDLDYGSDIVDMILQRIEPLSKEYGVIKDKRFRLYPRESEIKEFKSYMESQGVDFSKPVVLCAVVTRLEHKMWPLENMRDVLRRILNNYPDAQLVFNYGVGRERELAVELWEKLERSPRIFIDIEAKGLRNLLAMVSLSNFFFGNEGGPRHIAQAMDVPAFALFPPYVSKNTWLPDEGNGKFVGIEPKDIDPSIEDDENRTYEEIFEIVTPDIVWERLRPVMDRNIAK